MVTVLKSGLYTSIQDQGRFGFRDIGVPISGCMDSFSSQLANSILRNSKDAALIEITVIGPKLLFQKDTQIVICGAQLNPKLNNTDISNNIVYYVKANDIISFGKLKFGVRAYIAVKGGFKSNVVLGSRSYYKSITNLDTVYKGQVLDYDSLSDSETSKRSNQYAKPKLRSFSEMGLEVYEGPEFSLLTDAQQHKLLTTEYQVSSLYNRMAYRMEQLIENDLVSIITGPVLSGTVQLTPSGQLIVLMRDCQTTGGYPRVLQLSDSAINLLSQKMERDMVSFKLKHF